MGSGKECSYESPCSLLEAQNRVRLVNENMRADVVVYLRGGSYLLSSPLRLTSEDSGSNGHNVVYRACKDEKPVMSGGTRVSGWSLHDKARNIYRTYVGKSLQTRQLYVDGDEGFAAGQAGFRFAGPAESGQQEKPPASVSFSAAKYIRS
jgi:hypothetical protein